MLAANRSHTAASLAMLSRTIKNTGKRLLRYAFESGQRLGVDILPRHYYSEIPNVQELRSTTKWREPLSMTEIVGDIEAQKSFVDEATAPFRDHLTKLNLLVKAREMNGSDEGFGAIEADFLYCFVRKYQPRNILQVGCGVSTAVCLIAARDQGYQPNIICIEPHPTPFLKRASAIGGEVRLVEKKFQDIYQECAQWLFKDDLFFVDSSHTLGPSGEVTRIVVDVLPKLCSGVFVHFHDIWLPYDYSPHVLDGTLFFWHETALLSAFLSMNHRFRIEASLSMLHHQLPDALRRFVPTYSGANFVQGIRDSATGHFPSSIYLRG